MHDPPTSKVIKTAKGHTLQLEDADGGEMILLREGSKGHFLTLDQNGITVTDANSNTIQFSGDGIKIQGHEPKTVVQMTSDGIQIQDATGNTVTMSNSAFTLTAKVPFKIDASGQAITVVGASIDLQQG
ncbi:MAG: hypothetical protein WDO73_04445 [Ignavibacteriota bacterium]